MSVNSCGPIFLHIKDSWWNLHIVNFVSVSIFLHIKHSRWNLHFANFVCEPILLHIKHSQSGNCPSQIGCCVGFGRCVISTCYCSSNNRKEKDKGSRGKVNCWKKDENDVKDRQQ